VIDWSDPIQVTGDDRFGVSGTAPTRKAAATAILSIQPGNRPWIEYSYCYCTNCACYSFSVKVLSRRRVCSNSLTFRTLQPKQKTAQGRDS
jgi:hypothetical protein